MPRVAKAITDLRSLARSHTAAAVKVLACVMNQKEAPPSARVFAANSLLDRGWGKPDQAIHGDGSLDINVTFRQIVESIDGIREIRSEPVVIDNVPDPVSTDESTE